MVATYPHLPLSDLRAVGVFPSRSVARQVISNLKAAGIPLHQISLIARELTTGETRSDPATADENAHAVDKGLTVGALSGGALGSLTGLLVGLGTIAIPGVGPVMLAGGVATAIATTLAGGTIGAVAGGLLGALVGLGIPEAQAQIYHKRIAQGDCLILVEGTTQEIAIVADIFQQFNVEEYQVYPMAAPATTAKAAMIEKLAPPTPVQPIPPPQPVSLAPTRSNFTSNKYGVGIFATQPDAERAILSLKSVGFPIQQITLASQRVDQLSHVVGVPLSDRLETMRLGMPVEHARFYHNQLSEGQYIITLTGTEQELLDIATVLQQQGIQAWQMYDPSAIDAVLPTPSVPQTPVPPVTPPPVTPPTDSAIHTLSELTTAPLDYTLPTPSNAVHQPRHRAVGMFPTLPAAAAVLMALQQADFPMHQVAFLMKHLPDQAIPASLGNYVVGIGTMAIPGIGTMLVGGSVATTLVGATLAKGALIAASVGIVQAMVEQQISEAAARHYQDGLIAGNALLIIDGTEFELRSVEIVFKQSELTNWQFFEYSEPGSSGYPVVEPTIDRSFNQVKQHSPEVRVNRRRKAK